MSLTVSPSDGRGEIPTWTSLQTSPPAFTATFPSQSSLSVDLRIESSVSESQAITVPFTLSAHVCVDENCEQCSSALVCTVCSAYATLDGYGRC